MTLLVAAVMPSAIAAQSEAAGKQLTRGLDLLAKGRFQKASELLQRANEGLGGRSAPALVGLARAANGLGQPLHAAEYSQRALQITLDEAGRALASAELAVALATGAAPAQTELREAIADIRALLTGRERSPLTDNLRIRLCTARAHLPQASPFSLTRAPSELPRPEQQEGFERPIKVYSAPLELRGMIEETAHSREGVSVRAIIDADGCVTSPTIVDRLAHPDLAAEALRTVSLWAFDPARIDGVPIPIAYQLSLHYQRGKR